MLVVIPAEDFDEVADGFGKPKIHDDGGSGADDIMGDDGVFCNL